MIASVIIGVLILLYIVWVILKKRKDIKEGKMCHCGCSGCSAQSSCDKQKGQS